MARWQSFSGGPKIRFLFLLFQFLSEFTPPEMEKKFSFKVTTLKFFYTTASALFQNVGFFIL